MDILALQLRTKGSTTMLQDASSELRKDLKGRHSIMPRSNDSSQTPVTIEFGPQDWQILQQDQSGRASIDLTGAWWTIAKRKNPEVRVRVAREGTCSAIGRAYDWVVAETKVDHSIQGEDAGKIGTWKIKLKDVPCGGLYRVETSVGSAKDAIEWRRAGEAIHFLGVGDVWLIAGQSNAEGYGRDPVEDPAELGVHEYREQKGWQLAAHAHRHHPWLAFAKRLKKELGYPIGLIPTAVGGSPVSRWDPEPNGDLYANMAASVKSAGNNLKGVVWYQGESDTGPDAHPHYKSRFTHFLNGVRELSKNPRLPIITVQLNRLLSGENGSGWEAIREIQRQLSHELNDVFIISAFEAVLCDGIHNGALGNLLIAQRAADTALGGVYDKDVAFRHPECSKAEKVADNIIDLHFDHVLMRLDYACALDKGFPFAVRDEQGDVRVAGYSLPGHQTFRIELERSLAGTATVTGAPGSCPPHIIPKDINGYRAMLGFTIAVDTKKSG